MLKLSIKISVICKLCDVGILVWVCMFIVTMVTICFNVIFCHELRVIYGAVQGFSQILLSMLCLFGKKT